MEDRVKELNKRIQVKMQQQKNSTHNTEMDNPPPPSTTDTTTTTTTTTMATITTTVFAAPKSASPKQDGTTVQPVTRFQPDEGMVATGNYSDSVLTRWTMTRSPKPSASAPEPFC